MFRPVTAVGRAVAVGLLIWAVPFAVSVPLVDGAGIPRVPFPLFKAILVAALVVVTAIGFRWWVRRHPIPVSEVVLAAALVVGVNVALDAAVLVPLTGLTAGAYVRQVVPAYLVIPVVAVLVRTRTAARSTPDGIVVSRRADPDGRSAPDR